MSETDYSAIDRAFFERWPERNYRMRRIYPNEQAIMEARAREQGTTFCPVPDGVDPNDAANFATIKQLMPGLRVRKYCAGPRDLDPDLLSDEDARCAFEEGWVPLTALRR
jgi:hypothetical protein